MREEVDINHGVDFERARERLNCVAGAHFRRLYQARRGHADEATIERLRQAYRAAQREMDALTPRDEAAIQAVLARRPQPVSG